MMIIETKGKTKEHKKFRNGMERKQEFDDVMDEWIDS
jgi:hypothetical protein